MKQFEKLIVPVMIVFLVSKVAAIMGRFFLTPLAMQYDWAANTIALWSVPLAVIVLAVNIVVAIWLFRVAKQDSSTPWRWAFFGLLFGLTAAILFYAVRIHEMLKRTTTSEPTDAPVA